MLKDTRVSHIRGHRLRLSQAQKAMRNGWLTWTDATRTMVRDCTPAEQFEIQAQLAKHVERISRSEVPACRFLHRGARIEKQVAKASCVYSYLAQNGFLEAAQLVADTMGAEFAAGAAA